MKIDIYDATGKKKGDANLNKALFGAKINTDLMHRAVVMRLHNRRNPIAHTQTRADVTATRKKAFRQKGTGNARRGSKTTNLLKGGGVAHGPRNTATFKKMMPKRERRAALFSSLSTKAKEKSVFGLEGLGIKEPKTKTFVDLLKKLPEGKKHLFVLGAKDPVFQKSASNVPNVKVILAQYLNPYDLLLADQVCFVGDSLIRTEEVFLTPSA